MIFDKRIQLNKQKERIYGLVKTISNWEWEYLSKCNICGTSQRVIIANRDRYGFGNRFAICDGCGIGYLIDRLTPQSYQRFYNDGVYRDLINRYKKKSDSLEETNQEAEEYGGKILKFLQNQLELSATSKILDVGGSGGGVSSQFAKAYGCTATVVDPASEELKIAEARGLHTIHSTLEDMPLENDGYDLVIVSRTIEHFSNISDALGKIRKLVKPEGFIYIDYLDLFEYSRLEGCIESTSRLDHCFWMYKEMSKDFFARFGMEIYSSFFLQPDSAMGVLLKVGAKQEMHYHLSDQAIRLLLEQQSNWYRLPNASQPVSQNRIKAWLNNKIGRLIKYFIRLSNP
jgi:ubiquinone/menaquinone biosynthesis C-methylase UbiE